MTTDRFCLLLDVNSVLRREQVFDGVTSTVKPCDEHALKDHEFRVTLFEITFIQTHTSLTHRHNTRASYNNDLVVPKCRTNAGLRYFHASGTQLWNSLNGNFKNILQERNFKKHLVNKILNKNLDLEHFTITRTF